MSSCPGIFSRLSADERGHVAVTFAFLLVPMVMLVGIAADYGRALTVRTKIQNAADAAAMAAATAAAANEAERVTIAKKVFAANAGATAAEAGVQPEVTVGIGYVNVKANVAVPTTFLNIASIANVDVGATGAVQTAGKTLELSVMLDVTGSMGGQKIQDMKWAAKDMIDIVMPRGGEGSPTRIALVPFADRVNAGDYVSQVTGYNATRRGKRLRKCTTERQGSDRFSDEAPGSNRWIGPYDPSASIGSQYSNSGNCSIPEIKPLSHDRDMLRAHIDSFGAGGMTAGHLGTAWAWYMLSPRWNSQWPVASQSLPYNDETNIKAAVLMTDGEYNTDYSSGHSSTSMARELCSRMKAEGVVVYTIGFGIGSNSSARTTLQQCATSSSHYFFPYNGDELRAAFRSIGQALAYAQGSARVVI